MKLTHPCMKASFVVLMFLVGTGLACASCLTGSLSGFQVSGGKTYPQEIIRLQTDRTLYVAGENVWYTMYCLTDSPVNFSTLSRVAYVELTDTAGNQLTAQAVGINNGLGSHMLTIPSTIAAGIYHVRAYTAWMKNGGSDAFGFRTIRVINPFLPGNSLLPKMMCPQSMPLPRRNPPHTSLLSVTPLQACITGVSNHYGHRQQVICSVKLCSAGVEPADFRFSVSVAHEEESPVCNDGEVLSGRNEPGIWPGDIIHLPEIHGRLLSGIISDKQTGNPLENELVWLSWIGGNRMVLSARSNSSGRFYFELPAGTGNREAVLIAPLTPQQVDWITDDPFTTTPAVPLLSDTLPVRYSSSFLEQLLLNHQVIAAYGTDNTIQTQPEPERDFFGTPDQVIEMADYVKLPVMEEFFRELVKSVVLTREDGAYQISILDANLNRIIGPHPGYFIDGVPVTDPDIILQADPQMFSHIRVISSGYVFRQMTWDGILDLTTHTGDYSEPEWPANAIRIQVRQIERPVAFRKPDYSDTASVSSPLPDYRNLLHWEPELTLADGKPTDISFTTSDAPGRYVIEVHGVSADGRQVYGTAKFSVGR